LEGIVVPPASHQLLDDAVALNLERAELLKSGLMELEVEKCWGKDILDSGTNCTSITLTTGDECTHFFEIQTGFFKTTEYVRCEPSEDKCMTGSRFCWHVYDKDASAEAGHSVDMTKGKKDLTMVKVAPDIIINYGTKADADAKLLGATTLDGGINSEDASKQAKGPYLLVAGISKSACKKLVGTQEGNNKDIGRSIRYTAYAEDSQKCHTYETYFKLSTDSWATAERISAAWFYDNPNKAVEDIYATGDDPNANATGIGSGGTANGGGRYNELKVNQPVADENGETVGSGKIEKND